MNTRILKDAALNINERLLSAERNCDGMIADLATIALTISTKREEAGLSIHYGQDTFVHLAQGFAAATAARQGMIELHDGLAAQNKQLGQPLRMNGAVGKPPQVVPEMLELAA